MKEMPAQPDREALRRIATTFDHAEPVAAPLADVDIDVLQHAHDENVAFARDAEMHRSTIMTFVITGVGAVVYALAALKFDPRYWPIPLIAASLAAYAAVVVNIYHERWEFFMMIARGFAGESPPLVLGLDSKRSGRGKGCPPGAIQDAASPLRVLVLVGDRDQRDRRGLRGGHAGCAVHR